MYGSDSSGPHHGLEALSFAQFSDAAQSVLSTFPVVAEESLPFWQRISRRGRLREADEQQFLFVASKLCRTAVVAAMGHLGSLPVEDLTSQLVGQDAAFLPEAVGLFTAADNDELLSYMVGQVDDLLRGRALLNLYILTASALTSAEVLAGAPATEVLAEAARSVTPR